MSARRATTSPAPTAGPWIAETIGLEQSMTLWTRSRASRSTRVRTAKSSVIVSISSKLPPAENADPAPCTRATRTLGVTVDSRPHVGEVAMRVGRPRR